MKCRQKPGASKGTRACTAGNRSFTLRPGHSAKAKKANIARELVRAGVFVPFKAADAKACGKHKSPSTRGTCMARHAQARA